MKRRDLTPGREGGRGSKRIGVFKERGRKWEEEDKREDGDEDEDGRLREKRRR
jgi:hypothetical protein